MGNITSENEDFYSNYYKKPRWWFVFRYDTQYKIKAAIDALKKVRIVRKGISILEIGYGSGKLLFRFDRSCKIFGVEISDIAIKLAIERAAKLNYSSYAFEKFDERFGKSFPFADKKFDVIIASHVLEHVKDSITFIQTIEDRLAVNGVVLIIVPINERFEDPKHVHKFTTDYCIKLFKENNFNCVYSVENEFLYYMVENLYWKHYQHSWNQLDNFKRIIFNLMFSKLPFLIYKPMESMFKVITGFPPRQSVLVFRQNTEVNLIK